MLPSRLEELLFDINERGIIWVLLRMPAVNLLKAGDIDLLINPDQFSSVTRLLSEHGFSHLQGRIEGEHFLYYDSHSGKWIWLHIITQLSLGNSIPIEIEKTRECLERREQVNGIYRLAPSDAFWELIMHCLVDKNGDTLKHQERLQELAAFHPEESSLAPVINSALQPNLSSAQIVLLVHQGDWSRLKCLAPEITKRWRSKSSVLGMRSMAHRAMHRIRQFMNSFKNRGMSVAILGPDGAGKSTLISELEKSFIFPVRVIYMGLTGGRLHFVDRIHFPLLVIPMRLIIFWSRYLRAWYYQLHENLVLFDRYIYDYVVPTPYEQTRIQKMIRWIDGHSCPGPDLALILDAPGELMYQRKGEYNPKMLENWRQHFLAIQSINPNTERIDTSSSIEEMKLEATARIWALYLQRWEKLGRHNQTHL